MIDFTWSGLTGSKEGVANFSFRSEEANIECKDFSSALALNNFIRFVYQESKKDAIESLSKNLIEILNKAKP